MGKFKTDKDVNKTEFVQLAIVELRKKGYNFSIEAATEILNIFLYSISELLRNKCTISFQNVGSFMTKLYQGKNIMNVHTGKLMYSPAHDVVKFKPSKTFGFDSSKILNDEK